MGPRYIESDENTKLLYIDANILYGWAMSQYLPTGTFEKLYFPQQYELEQIVEDLRFIPDNNPYGFFKEFYLEYPAEIKKTSTLSLSNQSRSRVFLRLYEQCKTTQLQTNRETYV